jgi:hypothetical protein
MKDYYFFPFVWLLLFGCKSRGSEFNNSLSSPTTSIDTSTSDNKNQKFIKDYQREFYKDPIGFNIVLGLSIGMTAKEYDIMFDKNKKNKTISCCYGKADLNYFVKSPHVYKLMIDGETLNLPLTGVFAFFKNEERLVEFRVGIPTVYDDDILPLHGEVPKWNDDLPPPIQEIEKINYETNSSTILKDKDWIYSYGQKEVDIMYKFLLAKYGQPSAFLKNRIIWNLNNNVFLSFITSNPKKHKLQHGEDIKIYNTAYISFKLNENYLQKEIDLSDYIKKKLLESEEKRSQENF